MHLHRRFVAALTPLPCCIHSVLEARSRRELRNVVPEAEGNESLDRNLSVGTAESPGTCYTSTTLATAVEGFVRTEHRILWNRGTLIHGTVERLALMLWTNRIYDFFGFKFELLSCRVWVFGKIRQKLLVVNVKIPAIPKKAKLDHVLEH